MTRENVPFSMPAKLDPDLDHIWIYWNSLKRGDSKIPFSDDLKLSSLSYLSNQLMLVDVFERPQRFRFSLVGKKVQEIYGSNFLGKFADEIDPGAPLNFFISQASATIEVRVPTFFSIHSDTKSEQAIGRVLFPMWGNGCIETILGAIAYDKSSREPHSFG